MVDQSIVGRTTKVYSYQLIKEKILEYVEAIGENNPLYIDEAKAKEAGFESVIAPPTSIARVTFDCTGALTLDPELGIDLRRLLHGEQEYIFHRAIVAGETLFSQSKITDAFTKGTMDYILTETTVTTEQGEKVAEGKQTLLIRR